LESEQKHTAYKPLDILFEDNHWIVVNKKVSDIAQGDKTGDVPLSEVVKLYLKEKYNKPGNDFVGVTHRLDRPTTGIVIFAKTSKALARMNEMFKEKNTLKKTYWAFVKKCPNPEQGQLRNYLLKDEKQNKSFVCDQYKTGAKEALLNYALLAKSDSFFLVEIELLTGRHHQIRAQLAHLGCPIKGDLKYGFPRSNPDAGISLHARKIEFFHPVSKEFTCITAPTPTNDKLWLFFEQKLSKM
jgi:23S rRNA pseudouridine1911/1915/1917 synthase